MIYLVRCDLKSRSDVDVNNMAGEAWGLAARLRSRYQPASATPRQIPVLRAIGCWFDMGFQGMAAPHSTTPSACCGSKGYRVLVRHGLSRHGGPTQHNA